MKPTLVPGVAFSKRVLVDEERCISFMGRGSHVRFVVDTAKSRERIAAKRAKLSAQIK